MAATGLGSGSGSGLGPKHRPESGEDEYGGKVEQRGRFKVTTFRRLLRVLVADYDDAQRVDLTFMINRQTVPTLVHQARNGRQAVDMCALEAYDVIFMDLDMPVMDGLQATRNLRASGCTATIVGMISARVFRLRDHANMDEFMSTRSGLNECFMKTISSDDIHRILHNKWHGIAPDPESPRNPRGE